MDHDKFEKQSKDSSDGRSGNGSQSALETSSDHRSQDEQHHANDSTANEQSAKETAEADNQDDLVYDRGFIAWIQVLGSVLLFFNTFGVMNSWGEFQKYYESGALFTASSSEISWIGSIQSCLTLVIGGLTGTVFDAGHLRLLLVTGTTGVTLGLMMLSLCTEYWQVILAQGLTMGLGIGCLYVPAIAVLPSYFKKRISLALGIATFGSSVGGVIYPLVFHQLIDQIGFAWTVRTIGFIALGLLIIPVFCVRQRFRPTERRAMIDKTAFTDLPFVAFTIAGAVGLCGAFICIFYVSFFGQSSGILGSNMASYLVPILNAASAPGRLIPNYLSDKIGPLNVFVPFVILTGISVFCLIPVSEGASLIALTALIGFFSGPFFSLPGAIVVSLTEDKSRVGTRIGMFYTVVGLAVLAAGPGAGGILGSDPTRSKWTSTWTYSGVCIMVSGALLVGLKVYQSKGKILHKV